MAFKIGDVVQLKSGSRDMTVEASSDGETWCVWHSDNGQPQRKQYKDQLIINIEDIGLPPMQVDYDPFER